MNQTQPGEHFRRALGAFRGDLWRKDPFVGGGRNWWNQINWNGALAEINEEGDRFTFATNWEVKPCAAIRKRTLRYGSGGRATVWKATVVERADSDRREEGRAEQ